MEVRWKKASNGVLHHVKQCLTCGRNLGAVPKAWGKAACEFDAALEERWNRQVRQQYERWRHQQAAVRMEADSDWRRRYDAHLRSEKWRLLRLRVMRRCRGMCEGCGVEKAVQVHHLSYEHMGDEFLWELAAVCLGCHERVHGREIGGW